MPLLINVEASNYWLAFVLLVWAAGLALIFGALLRDRKQRGSGADASGTEGSEFTKPDLSDDDHNGMPGRRLIH